jgi:hypothetical protein
VRLHLATETQTRHYGIHYGDGVDGARERHLDYGDSLLNFDYGDSLLNLRTLSANDVSRRTLSKLSP